ncbi:MAG TPA: SGNH/GDSL hydrolase family protein [Planctomycetota bacterium]|nr:SGNH/GDSL hydrolase family protein [Planctomycetota bacterium]
MPLRLAGRIALVAAAPALFLAILEAALAVAGAPRDRYSLGPGSSLGRYWVPTGNGFERAISPKPGKPAFLRDKPRNGYRVFVLGESTVEGVPYGFGSFVEWLDVRMRAMLPARSVEVVNAGNRAWYASQIATLLDESLEHEPDLFVWAAGHNEFNPWNVHQLHEEMEAPALTAVKRAAWKLRTPNAIARIVPAGLLAKPPELLDRALDRELPCYGEERPLVERRFRETLDGAVGSAQRSHVPIVVCTMPRNVRTCPPNGSTFASALREDKSLRAQWDADYQTGVALLAGEKPSPEKAREAAAALRRAAAIDATPARLHFALGRALDVAGDAEGSRKEFLEALERDACPLRAQAWTETATREVARARGVPLVDLRKLFDDAGRDGVSGDELICDNVHPTLVGHERIADEVLRVLDRDLHLGLRWDLDVDRDRARDELGITQHEKRYVMRAECLSNFKLALQAGVESELCALARRVCAELLEADPHDWEIASALGLLEALAGDREKASARIHEALRESWRVRAWLAAAYRLEPPFQRALDAAGIDMAEVERNLTPHEREQFEAFVADSARR